MLREAFIESQRRAVAQAIHDQKIILVVGARDTNVQPDLVDSEHLTLWPWEDSNIVSKQIPKRTGVVLFTRFVRHATVSSVYKQAMANGAVCMQQVLQTGELKVVLSPLMAGVTPKPIAALPPPVNGHAAALAATPEKKKKKQSFPAACAHRGEIRDLVAEYANLDSKRVDEAKRLMEIAKRLGITTTLDSISQKITDARKNRKQGTHVATVERRDGALVYRAEASEPQPVSPAFVPTPPAPASVAQLMAALPSADDLSGNIDEAVRLLNESIAALTLVREEMLRTKAIVAQNASSVLKLRQLKELLSSI